MKKFLSIAFVSLLYLTSYGQPGSQPGVPIDTVDTPGGTMLIYANRTWVYLEDLEFDGVMNPYLHQVVTTDSNYLYKSYWRNDVTITCTTNEVATMSDTLWMCLQDSLHGSYHIPFPGRITSGFGYRRGRNHNGVDIDLETGDTIVSAWDGKVRYAQMHENGFGNLVIIRHYNGLETYYAHCSEILVAPNQEVKAGDKIALGGNTGHSFGDHLHFEIRFFDNPIDPELIFDFKNGTCKDNLLVHSGIFRGGKSASSGHSTGGGSYSVDRNSSTHRVRSGDTLGKIARMYGTTVNELCNLNHMRAEDVLQIGQVLKVK